MDIDHVMTADEIDALFKDDIKEADKAIPDIRVTFIKTKGREYPRIGWAAS